MGSHLSFGGVLSGKSWVLSWGESGSKMILVASFTTMNSMQWSWKKSSYLHHSAWPWKNDCLMSWMDFKEINSSDKMVLKGVNFCPCLSVLWMVLQKASCLVSLVMVLERSQFLVSLGVMMNGLQRMLADRYMSYTRCTRVTGKFSHAKRHLGYGLVYICESLRVMCAKPYLTILWLRLMYAKSFLF